ncbi:ROK family protein [Candidatus Cyanaurora vandensis]|uniref:ROK family protein n=2 Tax=Candidatus Cyanaurora vandensis TaxID=2714958 RepID=UPI00257B0D99|nr:ROK family protein [Candidatus Cyanaurora vandensis]
MEYAIALDLGGTAIKAGVYDTTGHQHAVLQIPTPQPAAPDLVLLALADLIEHLDPKRLAPRVGIGVPGVTDRAGRVVKTAINLHQWHHVPLAEQIEQLTRRATVTGNDANCAGLGEAWLGAARGVADALVLTLGTGVGGAVILEGRFFVGYNGAGAELGHIGLNMAGPPCNCGSQGCLEQYVSAPAITRWAGQNPFLLGQLARQGDPVALAQWEQMGRYLGAGLSSLVYIFTPQMIVIGGGVAASHQFFLPSALAELERRVLLPCRVGLTLCPALLGNDAGIAGAARLAFQTFP